MALLRFTKLEVPEYKLEMWLLTWTADNFTANTVPLLTKVVLDALTLTAGTEVSLTVSVNDLQIVLLQVPSALK